MSDFVDVDSRGESEGLQGGLVVAFEHMGVDVVPEVLCGCIGDCGAEGGGAAAYTNFEVKGELFDVRKVGGDTVEDVVGLWRENFLKSAKQKNTSHI